jgi:hypothetical protein
MAEFEEVDFKALEDELRQDNLNAAYNAEQRFSRWGSIATGSTVVTLFECIDVITNQSMTSLGRFAFSLTTSVFAWRQAFKHFDQFIDTPVI